MNLPKILISVALFVAVVGGIIYLNSQKASRGGSNEAVTVVPPISSDEKIVVSEKPSSDKKPARIPPQISPAGVRYITDFEHRF